MPNTIYTIGYSGYSIEEFIRELKAHGVNAVIDVRSTPFWTVKKNKTDTVDGQREEK